MKNFYFSFSKMLFMVFILSLTYSTKYSFSQTVIRAVNSGVWSSTTPNYPWDGGVVPTSANPVIINSGATVTINIDSAKCQKLTISSNATLKYKDTSVAGSLIVTDSVTINTNGSFIVPATPVYDNPYNELTIGGSLVVNGTLNFFSSDAGNNCGVYTYFNGSNDATISGTPAMCHFYYLGVMKGTDQIPVLDVTAQISIESPAEEGTHLEVTSGTIKISSASTLIPYYGSQNIVEADGRIWLNNSGAVLKTAGYETSIGPGDITINGKLQVDAGTVSFGKGNNTLLVTGSGEIQIGGSTATLNQRGRVLFDNYSGFTMTNGTFNVDPQAWVNLSSGFNVFAFKNLSTVSFTGGKLYIADPKASSDVLANEFIIYGTSGTKNFTGSSIYFGDGTSSSSGNVYGFRITIPSAVELDNVIINNPSGTNRHVTISAEISSTLNINNLTLTAGTLKIDGNELRLNGNISNSGTIDASSGSYNRLYIQGSSTQTLGGTILNNEIDELFINNNSGVTITPSVQINDGLTLDAGTLTCSGTLTVGSGLNASFAFTVNNGFLAATPVFNYSQMFVNYYYSGTNPRTTGNEIPSAINGRIIINNGSGVTLGKSLDVNILSFSNGILNTSASNILTVKDSSQAGISGGSATSYIKGPVIRTISADLTGALNYTFPIGKNGYNPISLNEVFTSSGANMTVKAEVFDANCGGSAGLGLSAINTNRYWSIEITGGSGIFTSCKVNLTETGLTNTNTIGKSSTLSGTYQAIGGTLSGETITSRDITSFSYFVIGTKAYATGSYAIGPSPSYPGYAGKYTLLSDAATALNEDFIVSGNLIFEFQSDYVGTDETVYAITFKDIVTSGGDWNVTFRPKAGVTGKVISVAGNYGINFDGGDRIIFDGRAGGTGSSKDLTIMTEYSENVAAIYLDNSSKYNQFKYCIIKGTSQGEDRAVIKFGNIVNSGGNSYNIFDNCDIRDANYTPYNAVYSNAGSVADSGYNRNNVISNCNIFNFFANGYNSNGINIGAGNTDWTISNNKFYQEVPRTYTSGIFGSTHTVIKVVVSNTYGDNFTITGNTIGYSSPIDTGRYIITKSGSINARFVGMEIYVRTNSYSNIHNNKITNIDLTTSSTTSTDNGVFTAFYLRYGKINFGTEGGNIVGSNSRKDAIVVSPGNGAGVYGICAKAYSTTVNINNNKVAGINLTGTTSIGGTLVGISTANFTGSGNYNIENNDIGSEDVSESIVAGVVGAVTPTTIVLGIQNSATGYINIRNNKIANLFSYGQSSSSYVSGIASTAGTDSVINNTIHHLVSHSTSNASSSYYTSVTGIYIGSGSGVKTINGNHIYTLINVAATATTYAIGLLFEGPTSGTNLINGNSIHHISLSTTSTSSMITGIWLNAGSSNIYNNMIHLGLDSAGNSVSGSYYIYGIRKHTSANLSCRFYHNSIYITGTVSGTAALPTTIALVRYNTAAVDLVKNNILVNTRSNATTGAKHYAFLTSNVNLLEIDNNIYYSTGNGSYTCNSSSTDYDTLPSWIAVVQMDSNSVEGNPNFVNTAGGYSTTNLHVQSPTPAERYGASLTEVTTDFDGQLRSAFTPNDIGADAGDYVPRDIWLPVMSYTQLTNGTNTNRTLTDFANIRDNAGVSGSPNKPRFYYKRAVDADTFLNNTSTDNGWKYVVASNSSSPYSFTVDYSILYGGKARMGDVIQYFVVAQDTSNNLRSIPVGATAAANPPVQNINKKPATPYSYKIYFNGTVTVGTSGDYPSLTTAAGIFAAINTGVFTANVTVNITSNTTEDAANQLTQWTEEGAGNYTLKIQPADSTEKLISGDGTSLGLIRLNNVKRVNIDGRYNGGGKLLRFRTTNTTHGITLLFGNDGSNNRIESVILEGAHSSTTAGVLYFGTASTGVDGNDNNVINNCDIRDRSDITGYPGIAIYATGTSGKTNSGNTISNCNIYNYFNASAANYGIYVGNYNTDLNIIGNRFYQESSRNFTTGAQHYGIYITNTSGNNFRVMNNTIGYASSSGTGTYTMTGAVTTRLAAIALNVGTTTTSSVQGNRVANISLNSTSNQSSGAGVFCGIYLQAGKANIGDSLGNYIGDTTTAGAITLLNTNSSALLAGISSGSTSIVNIEKNIIAGIDMAGSTSTTGGQINGMLISGAGTYSVRRNIIGGNQANSIRCTTQVGISTANSIIYGMNNTGNATLTIDSNIVSNCTAYGTGTSGTIKGLRLSGSGTKTVSNNQIYALSTAGTEGSVSSGETTINGIYVRDGSNNNISGNIIYNLSATSTTSSYQLMVFGISTYTTTSASVYRNRIWGLTNSGTRTTAGSPPAVTGIFTQTYTDITIYNNMISIGESQATNTEFIGIWNFATSTSPVKIYHNSIAISGSGATGAWPSYCYYRGQNSATSVTCPVDIRNNIFWNSRTSSAGKHYAIGNQGTTASTNWDTCNYNVFYSANSSTLGYWNATDYTFSNWQTISGKDSASRASSVVSFADRANGDLHLSGASVGNTVFKGFGIGINKDFDNQDRSPYHPYIGADERTESPFSLIVNVTALIEGLYDSGTNQMVSDTICLLLKRTISPYATVDSGKVLLNSSGYGQIVMPYAQQDSGYYFVVMHRNSIESWSSTPRYYSSSPHNFNITTAAGSIYGRNLVQKGSKWCIYSGDVNQDGQVSLDDLLSIDSDNQNFVTGYTATDVNGDGQVTLDDLLITDANNQNFVSVQKP